MQDASKADPPDPTGTEEYDELDIEVDTPSKRGHRRPRSVAKRMGQAEEMSTPRKVSKGKASFSTPKTNGVVHTNGTLLDLPDADRSARRKSARTIIERTIADDVSEDDEDEDLARHIYESEGEEEEEEEEEYAVNSDKGVEDDMQDPESVTETPSKKARGRPKGSKNRKRSLTPPQDLPPMSFTFSIIEQVARKLPITIFLH